jgi:hypothetical protein
MLPGPANEDYAAFVRQKIRERVKDPVVAEKLVPTDHMFGSKRLPCESGYYEVYNQDNVLLVDVREAPIERITPTGVKTRDAEYALDVLIFATGYDAVTGALTRIDIRGEGGQTLKDKFVAGPRTYMGIQSVGFPNLFTINAASVGNFVRAAEPLVDWVSDCIGYVRDQQSVYADCAHARGGSGLDAARRGGGREDSPDPGQLVVRGGKHSRESPVLAHQSGQRSGDAGQAGGGGGQGLCRVCAAIKHALCHRSGRQRYMAAVTRCHVHPLTSCVMIVPVTSSPSMQRKTH